ncbi:MAG: hypothetical protein WCX73_04155 [Candidatus Pacearchaeota archaeon]|jgi:hypothetical protein
MRTEFKLGNYDVERNLDTNAGLLSYLFRGVSREELTSKLSQANTVAKNTARWCEVSGVYHIQNTTAVFSELESTSQITRLNMYNGQTSELLRTEALLGKIFR